MDVDEYDVLVQVLENLEITESFVLWEDSLFFLSLGLIDRALQAARSSSYPDALWLVKMFPDGIKFGEKAKAKDMLLAQTPVDGRCLLIASLIARDDSLTDAAAALRYPRALLKNNCVEGAFLNDRTCIGKLAAMYEERGETERGLALLKLAARRKDPLACYRYSETFDLSNKQRWFFAAESACCMSIYCFLMLYDVSKCLENGSALNGGVLFYIGNLFKPSWNSGQLFGWTIDGPESLAVVKSVITFYDTSCAKAREECVLWGLCAKRLKFHKDITKLILALLWECRKDGIAGKQKEEIDGWFLDKCY
jgi:hypothetical protein